MKQRGQYVRFGVTLLLTCCAAMLFYDTVFATKAVPIWVGRLISVLRPIVIGGFIAYLLIPIMNFFDTILIKIASLPMGEKANRLRPVIRLLSVLCTWAVVFAGGYVFISILAPSLYHSVQQLISNAENYYRTVYTWVYHLLQRHPSMESWVVAQMNEAYQNMQKWLTTQALPQMQLVMTMVTGGVMSFLAFCRDIVVGCIVSIYFMAKKEEFAAFFRKLCYSLLPENYVKWVFRGCAKINRICSGYVRGKLLDSLIIGLLCFLICSIMEMPYTSLVSTIVGITNIIPFVGPFLGAIPSIFLILLAAPVKAVQFFIMVLVLQQLDGNVIGPKILGDQTGMSGLWIIIAILMGGGFFGLPGMFFSVPVCACLLSLISFLMDSLLQAKNLPTDRLSYADEETLRNYQKYRSAAGLEEVEVTTVEVPVPEEKDASVPTEGEAEGR